MYTIHIVPHTHWDREWYFTTSRSTIYLEYDFKRVLDKLEESKDFTYLLDGQTSLVEDYLKLRPFDKDRIEKFVKEGRLFIGPWYTQTDQMLVSDESIVRNLFYGMKIANNFGGPMKIGYVPDSFGQAGNMPQVYKDVGFESCMFWRGVSDDEVNNTEFLWKGDDNTSIKAFQIPYGYYIGGNIPENTDELKIYLNEFKDKIGKKSSTNHLYLPNGFDQAPIRTNLGQIIEKLNIIDDDKYVLSTIKEYIDTVSKISKFNEEVHGELTTGKTMRIHKSIYSSRSDIKIMNTKTQNLIVNCLEPLLAISSYLGNEYSRKSLEQIWKLMFENAAHDSIGSCVSDNTNKDIIFRYKQVLELSESLMELNARLIATRYTDEDDQIIQLYNFLPYTRSEVVITEVYFGDDYRKLISDNKEIKYVILDELDQTDYVKSQTINLNPSRRIKEFDRITKAKIALYIDKVNSMGFSTIKLVRGDSSVKFTDSNNLENKYIEASINENGSFDILDKKNNIIYYNQGVIEENGDDGDSFNYSPPRNDMKIRFEGKADINIINSQILDIATIKYNIKVPKDLHERSKGIRTINIPVEIKLLLGKNQKKIDIKVKIDNKAYSHRMTMIFDAGFTNFINYSDAIFGSVVRKNIDEKIDQWQKNKDEWNEKPISINPLQTYVMLKNKDNHSISVFPKGVREYEIIDNQKIYITLFRTYSHMGKENLLYRPGRASGEKIIKTPEAQLIGEFKTELSTSYGMTINETVKMGKRINTQIYAYQYGEFLNGRLIFSLEYQKPDLSSDLELLKFKNNHLKLSAFKPSENYDGYIMRLVNSSDKQISEVIDLSKFNQYSIYKSNILEEKIINMIFDKSLEVKLDPNKFLTLLLIKNKSN